MTGYFNLNNNEISEELLVIKINTMLGSQGRLTSVATKASLVKSYSKVPWSPL